LGGQGGRGLGVDELEHLLGLGAGGAEQPRPQVANPFLNLLNDLAREVFVIDLSGQTEERVLRAPGLDLGRLPVASGVVGGGVSAQAVGQGLDQGRTAAGPRWMGAAVWRATGTEIAHWLFCTKKTTGARKTPAKFMASCTSPSEVAPSPK